MLFKFHRYIPPTWYYNLAIKGCDIPYFVDYRKLSLSEQNLLDIDHGYSTVEATLADAAYQAWRKGIIKSNSQLALLSPSKNEERTIRLFKNKEVLVCDTPFIESIEDNYRFIRRFFSPIHWYIILIVRLLSFHNPVREMCGWFRSRVANRVVNLYETNAQQLYQNEYDEFESILIKSNPKISVIIPTLNRYDYLKNVMLDLEKQDYKNFEVIVCDQSEPINEDFYQDWKLDIVLIRQEEKALWLARNKSIKKGLGTYIALSEDDVRVEPSWIREHLRCIDFFNCDISAGPFYPEGKSLSKARSFFRFSDQFATGNAMFKKDMMLDTGMFDRQFEKQRAGDGEYGMRCYLLGYKSISNPFAVCVDVKAPQGGLRQMGSWDSFRPTKIFAPRPIPSILYLCRKYHGDAVAKLMLLFSIPGSLTSYKHKGNKYWRVFSVLSLLVTWPIILTQILISWHQASIKLKEGDLIEKL